MSSSADLEDSINIFNEPQDYYPPLPKPKIEKYRLLSGHELTVRLVGYNPLWGHYLWNAGRVISSYLESQPSLVESKTVLELGAGAGLPSLVSAVLGARTVVVTDYPDPDLIENLRYNIDTYQSRKLKDDQSTTGTKVIVEGYLWGADPAPLFAHLQPLGNVAEASHETSKCFDIIILADLLFNHSEHAKLVSSIQQTLSHSKSAQALVFFTAYRPWLLQEDLAFFDLVKSAGLVVRKIREERMEKVMFEEDRGDEEIRRTVFGYALSWKAS